MVHRMAAATERVHRRVLVGLPLALLATPVQAHHGFSGRYDAAQPIFLAGTVVRAAFQPPHPTLILRIAEEIALPNGTEFDGRLIRRPQDQGQLREVEFPPVQLFYALASRIALGDRVAVIAYRNCAAPHQLRGQWIRLRDGSIVVRSGRMQSDVEACR